VISAASRKEWRDWLEKNHASEREAWLVYYKKHTGKASISYRESVEEALCFGWIDGIKKRIDDERYMHRFTPRRKASKWSALNIRLARELIEAGEMTAAGLKAFKERLEYDTDTLKAMAAKDAVLSEETEKYLRANKKVWGNFNKLAPGYRKRYAGWIQSAKKPETREKRLNELIAELEKGRKPGMK
jgi:uncharacterized protein YdeI (YjbR/CyaY-like superfamily)